MRLTDDTVRGCVGFVDLVGSTTLSRRLSPRELAAFVDRFEEVASAVATRFGGRVVKFIGDEVMVVTARPGAACDIALTLIERFAADGTVTPRGGIASGALLDRSGDYYGPVVNLAARTPATSSSPDGSATATERWSLAAAAARFATT